MRQDSWSHSVGVDHIQTNREAYLAREGQILRFSFFDRAISFSSFGRLLGWLDSVSLLVLSSSFGWRCRRRLGLSKFFRRLRVLFLLSRRLDLSYFIIFKLSSSFFSNFGVLLIVVAVVFRSDGDYLGHVWEVG